MDRAGRLYICHWGMKKLWFPRDGKTKTCSTVTIRPAGNRLSVACYINHSLCIPASQLCCASMHASLRYCTRSGLRKTFWPGRKAHGLIIELVVTCHLNPHQRKPPSIFNILLPRSSVTQTRRFLVHFDNLCFQGGSLVLEHVSGTPEMRFSFSLQLCTRW
jgi:hypothetical protein